MKKIVCLLLITLALSLFGCSSSSNSTIKEYDEIVDILDLDVSNCTRVDLLQFMKESYIKTFEGNGVGEAFIRIDDLADGDTVYENNGIKIVFNSELYHYYEMGSKYTSGFDVFVDEQYVFSFVYYIKEYEHKLSNGDIVFVSSKMFHEHDDIDLGIDLRTLVEQYSIYPANSEKEYKVQGLKEIITKKEDVDISSVLNTIKEFEKVENDYNDSFSSLESANYDVEIKVHNIYWLTPKDSYFYGKYACDENVINSSTYGYFFCDIKSVIGIECEFFQTNGEYYYGIVYIYNPYKGDSLCDAYSSIIKSSHETKAHREAWYTTPKDNVDYSELIEEMKEMYDIIQLN